MNMSESAFENKGHTSRRKRKDGMEAANLKEKDYALKTHKKQTLILADQRLTSLRYNEHFNMHMIP